MKLKLLVTSLLILTAVACGKKDDSSSSSNVFRSGVGTGDGIVLVPAYGGGQPMIQAGGGTYQLQAMNQQVFDTVNAMYRGQIQPYRIDAQYKQFRVRVSGSLTQNAGYGANGYSVGGSPQQPVGNILYVQSIQPI